MLNQRLLGLLAVMSLLLPVNIQSLLPEGQQTSQANTEENTDDRHFAHPANFLEYLLLKLPENKANNASTEDQQVTTLDSKQTADNPQKTQTSEKDLADVIQEWESNLPFVEENSKQAQFINTILPAAILIADEHGIYPSVMIAQAALESSWGQSDLAQTHNNLMGTKGSWKGKSVTVRTREDRNGESVYIDAGFSVYDSWADSLYRYGLLMKNGIESNPAIYEGTWRENADDYTDATAWLQGRYATDTAYANKLNRTIQSFNLNQYDDIESPGKNLEKVLAQLTIENQTDL
jgi:flagellum-specific peptidoglycan hydrolase FlgJ